MNKIFLIQPRQAGKTTIAIYEFLKDPENSVLVMHSQNMVEYVHDKLRKKHENVVSCENFAVWSCSRSIKNVILDEYMFFPNKDYIREVIYFLDTKNLFINSTFPKAYPKKLVQLIRDRKCNHGPDSTLSYIVFTQGYQSFLIEDFIDLYHNFFTDPDIKIIDTNLRSIYPEEWQELHNSEQFEVKILNKYLID